MKTIPIQLIYGQQFIRTRGFIVYNNEVCDIQYKSDVRYICIPFQSIISLDDMKYSACEKKKKQRRKATKRQKVLVDFAALQFKAIPILSHLYVSSVRLYAFCFISPSSAAVWLRFGIHWISWLVSILLLLFNYSVVL